MSAEAPGPLDAWSRARLWLEVVVEGKPSPWWERGGRIVLGILLLPIAFLSEFPEAAGGVVLWSRYQVVLRTRTGRIVLRTWGLGGDGAGARDLARRLQDDLDRLDPSAFTREWNLTWRPG